MTRPHRYLLLPPRGLQSAAAPASRHLAPLLRRLGPGLRMPPSWVAGGMRVLDSVHDDGVKLVELTPQALLDLRSRAPGLRIVPEVFYEVARAPRPQVCGRPPGATGAASGRVALRFVWGAGGAPLAKALVIALTDTRQGLGDQGHTNADGVVRLSLGDAGSIARLYVYPREGCWPTMRRRVALPASGDIVLRPIDLAVPDLLQTFRPHAPGRRGKGVTVGIVDTGCGPHPDLPVAGGLNTVYGQSPDDWADNGDQHGTHVAGIVGARGRTPGGLQGLAPEAALRAYRVFAKGQGASNFAIAKAIDRAVADGCDLINMSLAGGPADPATSAAIADARAAGVVVVCASGNDGEAQVGQPAADSRAVAVGCFGRRGTFPADAVSATTVGRPRGNPDRRYFRANFSNHGPEIDFAGPGVGIVSSVPGGGFAVMDGTSMACPAVTGMLARLLSARPALLHAPRDQARSDALLQVAFAAARSLGFGPQYEGQGWILGAVS